jgi:hypothetical protein
METEQEREPYEAPALRAIDVVGGTAGDQDDLTKNSITLDSDRALKERVQAVDGAVERLRRLCA